MFAERLFDRWGARAVFLGRFIALLRIFAGPLAGALKMRYARFLVANVSGAMCWAGGTTALVYYAGVAAERWLTRFSWIALVVAVVCGVIAAVLLRERASRAIAELGGRALQRIRPRRAPEYRRYFGARRGAACACLSDIFAIVFQYRPKPAGQFRAAAFLTALPKVRYGARRAGTSSLSGSAGRALTNRYINLLQLENLRVRADALVTAPWMNRAAGEPDSSLNSPRSGRGSNAASHRILRQRSMDKPIAFLL